MSEKLDAVLAALESVGWHRVHTWVDSHGRSTNIIFEERIPLQRAGGASHMVVFVDRDPGRDEKIRLFSSTGGSYLLAQEIATDQKQSPSCCSWIKVRERVSVCCSAVYTLYREQYCCKDAPNLYQHVLVSRVAGHGETAVWVKNSEAKTALET